MKKIVKFEFSIYALRALQGNRHSKFLWG